MKNRSLVFLAGLSLSPFTLSAFSFLWITDFVFWDDLSLNKSIMPLFFLLHKLNKSKEKCFEDVLMFSPERDLVFKYYDIDYWSNVNNNF